MVGDAAVRMRGSGRHRRADTGTRNGYRQPAAPTYVGLPGVYRRHCRMRMDMLGSAKRGDLDSYCRGRPCNSRIKHRRHLTANSLIHNNVITHRQCTENFFSFFRQKIWWETKRAVTLHRKSKNGLPCERPKSTEVDAKF